MVLYDDKKWLCRLIRTAFTIEDDSGVCEKVLKEKPFLGNTYDPDSSSDSSDDSLELREGADIGHRRRSNTAIRLEKLEKQRRVQNLTQVVRVGDVARNELVFEKNEDFKSPKKLNSVVKIGQLLESAPNLQDIPYAIFAKYEACCHPSVPCKELAIFVACLPSRFRSYPLKVSVVSTAKVVELIGLVLWLTSQKYPDVKLKSEHEYGLYIADDDGEWDTDIPHLDSQELMSKFSFSHLALVPLSQSTTGESESSRSDKCSVMMPSGTTLKLALKPAERSTLTLSDLIKTVLNTSGWSKIHLPMVDYTSYHLEKIGHPNMKFRDLSITIKDSKCKEFCLVRNGAKSVQTAQTSDDETSNQPTTSFPGGRSELYPVTVIGTFNRMKNALCVIWGNERIDLEFQSVSKTKSYFFSQISSVKMDSTKNRIIISLSTPISAMTVGSHYIPKKSHLHLSTSDLRTANELYHHILAIVDSKAKPLLSPLP